MIEYRENGDLAVLDGYTFRRDKKTGYFLSSKPIGDKRKRLHKYVWEKAYGSVPNGYDIHHIDHNKNNNELDNLRLVTSKQHHEIHSEELTDEQREKFKKNLIEHAIPASKEWHKSDFGREWHKMHYESMKEALYKKSIRTCDFCGKEYETIEHGNNRFCSNNCKMASRRKSGVDNVERMCCICGRSFTVNRYAKAKTCSRPCAGVLRRGKKRSA